jgi:hypothetical protein
MYGCTRLAGSGQEDLVLPTLLLHTLPASATQAGILPQARVLAVGLTLKDICGFMVDIAQM